MINPPNAHGGWEHADLGRLLADADQISGPLVRAALLWQLTEEAGRRLIERGYQVERTAPDEPTTATWTVTRGPQTLRMNDRQLIRCAIAIEETQAQLREAHATLEQTPGGVQHACSWCHTMNAASEHVCRQCGHEAHAPRILCRCQRCRPQV